MKPIIHPLDAFPPPSAHLTPIGLALDELHAERMAERRRMEERVAAMAEDVRREEVR